MFSGQSALIVFQTSNTGRFLFDILIVFRMQLRFIHSIASIQITSVVHNIQIKTKSNPMKFTISNFI